MFPVKDGRLTKSLRALQSALASDCVSTYIVLILISLAMWMQSATCDARCEKSRGVALASKGDYRAAILHFAEACRLNAREPDACYYWGRALYSSDRFEEALDAFDLALVSTDWKVATARGQSLDALGRPEAEGELKRALTKRSKLNSAVTEPDPLLALGSFLYREGRSGEALKLLKEAPPQYRRVTSYHYQLGRALAQHQRWEESAEALKSAVDMEPGYSEAHALLGRAYYRLGKAALGAEHSLKATQGSVTSR